MKSGRLKFAIGTLIKFGLGFFLVGALLFFSAGSLVYVNGWILIIALAAPMIFFGVFLLIKDPGTLERRLASKEPDNSQRLNITISGLMFVFSFSLSGIDYRFGWSGMSASVVVSALIIMLAGYGMFVVVILQNSYAARVVAVYDGQKIITEGLYSVVRHPMYLATLLIFMPMPLILGSWFAAIPMLAYPVIIVRRIKGEEALLLKELAGYGEYVKRVKYRLLPFVW